MIAKPQCIVVKLQHIYGSYTFKSNNLLQKSSLEKSEAMHIHVQQNYIFNKKNLLTHCFVLEYFKVWARTQLNYTCKMSSYQHLGLHGLRLITTMSYSWWGLTFAFLIEMLNFSYVSILLCIDSQNNPRHYDNSVNTRHLWGLWYIYNQKFPWYCAYLWCHYTTTKFPPM